METAKDWKDKGNGLVKEKKYKEALDCYSKAIEIDPNDPILYSNRSLMHINLSEFDQAITDAEKAISIKPEYAKAYLRKGKALEGKRLILSITCGAPLEAFKEGGFQNYTIEDLTKGFHQLANLCSMKWDGFVTTGSLTFFLKDKPEEMKKMKERLEKHAEELSAKVKSK